MITGTIFVCDKMAYVLFDLGYTYSYVSIQFMVGWNMVCDVLDYLVYVPNQVSESVVNPY